MQNQEFLKLYHFQRNILPKIKTKSDFSQLLKMLFIEKRNEINEMLQVLGKDPKRVPLFKQKAFILLSYGHLEGFIKESSDFLISYITFSKYKGRDLALPVKTRLFYKDVKRLAEMNRTIDRVSLLQSVEDKLDKRADIDYKTFIDTQSNLSWDILEDIIFVFGLDKVKFLTKKLFLEKSLLSTRNALAHKGKLDKDEILDITTTMNYIENCLSLINDFRDELEICVQHSKFKNSSK